MDTQRIGSQHIEDQIIEQKRRLPRVLTIAAVACFALPFLTVTCYGETTVSGVQAATEIDLYPNDPSGEAELIREEDPNLFAFAALAAAIVALALTFGSARSRELTLWPAAVGALALSGLFAYAFYRSWGGVWPRIGFVGALLCLVGTAWAGAGHVPRWVGVVIAGAAASMIPGTVLGMEDLVDAAWLSLPVYAGVFLAVALVVGAIRAPRRPPILDLLPSPSTLRVVFAALIGVVCIAAAGIGSFFLMGAMVSGDYGPDDAGQSYLFAIGMLVGTIAASEIAWIAGDAVAHGRRRVLSSAVGVEVGA
jgi:hypothetical protein